MYEKNILFLLLASLFLVNCNNDDNGDDGPTDPLDELPAATQTGAQTRMPYKWGTLGTS